MDLALGQVTALEGADGQLTARWSRATTARSARIGLDAVLPFFGLTMKLGPVADWGLESA